MGYQEILKRGIRERVGQQPVEGLVLALLM